jgi:hypothetical protein
MEWMPGDDEAAAAIAAMQELDGRTGLAITPDVRRTNGMDRIHLTRDDGDRIRVVILQRVGGDGTDSSARRWVVVDAFAVCSWGHRTALVSRPPIRVGALDDMVRMAERFCRLGRWQ